MTLATSRSLNIQPASVCVRALTDNKKNKKVVIRNRIWWSNDIVSVHIGNYKKETELQ